MDENVTVRPRPDDLNLSTSLKKPVVTEAAAQRDITAWRRATQSLPSVTHPTADNELTISALFTIRQITFLMLLLPLLMLHSPWTAREDLGLISWFSYGLEWHGKHEQ